MYSAETTEATILVVLKVALCVLTWKNACHDRIELILEYEHIFYLII